MTEFTPISSGIGGILIGLASALLLLTGGKIAGISGITGNLISGSDKGDTAWRVAFVLGLLGGGLVALLLSAEHFAIAIDRSSGAIIAAGLLVGLGTRIGNGCTSGHGVCGISRFSGRSIVATLSFMTTGAITVFIVQHLLGASL